MASRIESTEKLLSSIESVMVNQFRICQSLKELTQQERQILIDSKGNELVTIVEKKETLLDDLGRLEASRKEFTERLLDLFGAKETTNLVQVLDMIGSPSAERINHLRQGILALQEEISELNKGNYALANLNLERLGAVQGFLINLYSSTQRYQPEASTINAEPPASVGMDHQA